ncbi:MAG: ABC transporter permease subunit [Clostridium fessum]
MTYYRGIFGSIQPRVLPSTGFDAIAVALLAGNHPIGIIFSSLLITVISKGSTYYEFSIGLESEDRIRYQRIDPAVFRLRCIYPLQSESNETRVK